MGHDLPLELYERVVGEIKANADEADAARAVGGAGE
jgi:hypothetical protein